MTENAVVIYADDVSWFEFEIGAQADSADDRLEAIADTVMEQWLEATPDTGDDTLEDWDRLPILTYENHGQHMVTFVPYRGENVTFIFWT